MSMLLFAGCGTSADSKAQRVVATTPVMADLVRNVAPPGTEITTLLKPGADPHTYEVRPDDARALAEADLVVRSGGELDEWLDDAQEAAGGEAETITPFDPKTQDPHWWHDPRNVLTALDAIASALQSKPGAYATEVEAADKHIVACFEAIPADRRKLVTTHDALGAFAERYGIEVIGTVIPSRSTAGQPSVGETEKLVDLIRRENVTTIFPESSVSPKVERAIADEAGAKLGEPLYADTLGEDVSYLDALRHNARAIAAGMGGRCDA